MAKKAFRFISLISSILLVFALFTTPTPIQAADCDPVPAAGCSGTNSYFCSITIGGNTKQACCTSSTTCTSFKQGVITTPGNSIGKINPEGSCTDGIDTALGCLPYKSQNGQFTSILLTFLAGIVGAIALVVMLMATISIMTAGGNPEQVQKGKELLTGAITGLLFIIFSVTLLRLVAGDIIKLPGF